MIHGLAHAEKNAARQKAYRAAAQIAAIPHVKLHAPIASDYAVKMVNLLHPRDMDAVRIEPTTQYELMKSV